MTARSMGVVLCFLVLALGVQRALVEEQQDELCGYVDDATRCPGCTPQGGTVGCSCNESTGDCVNAKGGQTEPTIHCKWGNWSYTPDEDGDSIGTREKICMEVTLCRTFIPGLDCNALIECDYYTSKPRRTEYYLNASGCPQPG